MKSLLALLVAICSITSAPAWAGFITIDNLSVDNYVSVNRNGTQTDTIASSGAIGGYRTLTLTNVGDNRFTNTFLIADGEAHQISLNTPTGNTATSFKITWAGAAGTGFDIPVNFLALPSGLNSTLQFELHSSDLSGQLTWKFTDTGNRIASYTDTLPVHHSGDPSAYYSISLSNFSNPSNFNWTLIKSVELSGGGVAEWDFSISGPLIVGVPEPSFLGPLVIGLGFTAACFRRR